MEGTPLPESFFSVQFISPYLAANPARLLGLSASTVFIILMPVIAASSALALFWVLATITRDHRLSAIWCACCPLPCNPSYPVWGPARSLFPNGGLMPGGLLAIFTQVYSRHTFPFFVGPLRYCLAHHSSEENGIRWPCIGCRFDFVAVVLLVFLFVDCGISLVCVLVDDMAGGTSCGLEANCSVTLE
jgi:hypothetical protein